MKQEIKEEKKILETSHSINKFDKKLLKISINRELDKLDYRLKQIEVYLGIPKDERYNYLGI